jgi:hypothetical protein
LGDGLSTSQTRPDQNDEADANLVLDSGTQAETRVESKRESRRELTSGKTAAEWVELPDNRRAKELAS